MAGTFLRYSAFRLVVAVGALAWGIWLVLHEGTAQLELFRAVSLALALIVVVLFVVRGRTVSRRFQLFQLALDVVLASFLSEMSGGLHSLLSLLYFLNIGAGAYLLRREGALWTATFAAIGLLGMAAWGGELDVRSREALLTVWSEAMFRVFAFYLMALLTGQLSETLARTDAALEEQRENTALLASEHDTVLDRVRAGVLSTGPDGRVASLNPFGRGLLGDVRGQPLRTVLPGTPEEGTWEEQRDGGQRWVCSRAALPDGGAVIVIEDITELTRMREVAERDERMIQVGRMAAGMAHEIRNPLASLSGSLQLIREEHPSRLADLALGEAERLNRLVEDFLDVARRRPLSPRPTDVQQLAAEVCEAFARDPRYTGKVDTRCEGAPSVASVDPDRLRQALWNLVLNGAQAMPRGGAIRVRVAETPPTAERAPGVELVVADEGPGIPAAERARVFDPFYTTRAGGTGLGLLLVEQVARGHGGQVRIEPGAERGTAFHLWLPREARHVA